MSQPSRWAESASNLLHLHLLLGAGERSGKQGDKISTENTLYIVDGKRVSSEDFNKIYAQKIKSIIVNKNADSIKNITNDTKYQAVITVITKQQSHKQ